MPAPTSFTRSSPTRTLCHNMFDRSVKALQRGRVSAPHCDLHKIVADQMLDRRGFIKRDTPVVLEVGAHTGWFFRHMLERKQLHGLKQYIQTDISEERLNENYNLVKDMIPPDVEFVQICCDEEVDQKPNPFGIPERSVDLVVSNLSMHWVNDLETTMVSLRKTLKKDCFVIMSMFGANTLFELRSSFSLSMNEVHGGIGTHVSPMIDGAGISSLMLQSGYNLTSIDLDRHVLLYDSPFHVLEHIQAMGESACHIHRRPLDRATLATMAAVYQGMYERNRLVPATFEIFHCIAWSPGPNQAKPLSRGSGQIPIQTISTSEHKELQNVLDEYAKNPTDEALREKAEAILMKMREDSEKQLTDKGFESDGKPLSIGKDFHGENFSGRIAPPGQDK